MNIFRIILATCLTFCFVNAANAGEHGTKDEAVALVHKVIAYYKANGKDKTFAEVNDKSGQFVDRDLYVWILDTNGTMMAHGANQRLIGKDLAQLRDVDGKFFAQELLTLAKSKKSGWVEYKWPDPVSKKVEDKTTYIEPFDGLGFAVGVYR